MKQLLLAIFMLAQVNLMAQSSEQQQKTKILFSYFEAETQKKLELTEDQKVKLLHIRNEIIAPKIRAMNTESIDAEALRLRKNDINYETRRLYFEVLTREQKKKVATMISDINKQNKANGFD